MMAVTICRGIFLLLLAIVTLFSIAAPIELFFGEGAVPRLDPEPQRIASAIEHVLAYSVTAAFGWAGYGGGVRLVPFILCLALYGVGLETAQAFIPGRTADLLDAAANLVGVLAGTAIASVLLTVRARRRAPVARPDAVR